jgi:signal transduction histidine kinase
LSPARARLRAAANARRLAALDDQKRSFLRMVSHELRTPLNAIIGFSEIIACELYGPLGAPQYKEYAEHVRTSGHKLLRLVNQVLEIARLEGHALDLAVVAEPLDHAVEDALLALREEIAAHEAEITVINADDPGAPLPAVMADARGLRTLLVNLLQNAIVHGAPSPVILRVSRIGGDVQLSVEDSGPGVPADCVSKLIRPFEHAETALTRGDGGAGLGLPIVHLLCQAMGATLKLRSAKGEGFTATVTLAGA